MQDLQEQLMLWEQAGYIPYTKLAGGDLGFILRDPTGNHKTQYVKIYAAHNPTPIVQAVYSSLQHKKGEDIQCWFELSPKGKAIFLISPEVTKGLNIEPRMVLKEWYEEYFSDKTQEIKISQFRTFDMETPGAVQQAMYSAKPNNSSPGNRFKYMHLLEHQKWQELDQPTKKACYGKLLSHCLEA